MNDYKIIKSILTLSSDKKYHKELNLMSWNVNPARYDLRGWTQDHKQMTKGITFDKDELVEFKEKLGGLKL